MNCWMPYNRTCLLHSRPSAKAGLRVALILEQGRGVELQAAQREIGFGTAQPASDSVQRVVSALLGS